MNYAIAYAGGLLTFLAPCGAFLLPAFFTYAFGNVKTLIYRALTFLIGLLIALLPLGFAAGSVGAFLQAYMGIIIIIMAILIIISGVIQILAIKPPSIPLPGIIAGKIYGDTSMVGILALGISYGLAGVGCTGPILGAVLSTAVTTGSALAGMIMMFWYALGMFTPIFILTLLWKNISPKLHTKFHPRPITIFGRNTTIGALVSGIIFVILGMLLAVFQGSGNFISLTSSTQTNLELQVQRFLADIPNWAIIVGIILLVIFTGAGFKALKESKSDSSHISE